MLECFKTVLVLSPHTDDGELGAGGTIAYLTKLGATVHYAAFSTAAESLPAGMDEGTLAGEVKKATHRLGIENGNLRIYDYQVRKLNYRRQDVLENLISLRCETACDLVLMPSLHDIHQDHSTVAQEALRAFKNTTILSYELIWNNLNFNTGCFVTLSEDHVRSKCDALREYQSQQHRPYMDPEFIVAQARTRGVQIGAKFAEVFEVVRWVMH